ncbi:WXG100 family type VII secretion target [Planctomicrobium sp. SH664]|uniref:WXG100 family type VII secretion target n=1 Tax=Planctomicrobium sp. SH664 TaxID=3448125 RepID=UPI003F5B6762
MAQAIANPEDLRGFALKLKQFNNSLADQATMLSGQLDALSATWRDQENAKFSEEFKEHLRLLAQFVEANNRHIPYLLRKAERLDEYLQQR